MVCCSSYLSKLYQERSPLSLPPWWSFSVWVPALGDWSKADTIIRTWTELRLCNKPEKTKSYGSSVPWTLTWKLQMATLPSSPGGQPANLARVLMRQPYPKEDGSNRTLKTNQDGSLVATPIVFFLLARAESRDAGVIVRQTCKWAIIMQCNMEMQIPKWVIHLHPGIGCSQKTEKTCPLLILEGGYRDFWELVCGRGQVGEEHACWWKSRVWWGYE